MGYALQQINKTKQNTENLQNKLSKKLKKITNKSFHFIHHVEKSAKNYDTMSQRTHGLFNEKDFFRPLELKEQIHNFYYLLDNDKLSYHMKKELLHVSIDRYGDGDDGDSCDDYSISWTILMIFIYDNDYAR
jgi:hypothetical protein